MANPQTDFSQGKWVVSTAATATSAPYVLGQERIVSLHITVANVDSVGTLAVQSSNDGTNWCTVGFLDQNGALQTSLAVTSGVNPNTMLVMLDMAEAQIRLVYTRTSGGAADTLTAVAVKKRG